MLKSNPRNERIKREYFQFLKEAKGKAATTIDAIAKALRRFEEDTKFKDFKTFRREQAVAFKTHLANTKRKATGEPLSLSTQLATLTALTEFFLWLYPQRGFKSKIRLNEIQYFTMSNKDIATAKAPQNKPHPTLAQIQHVVACLPSQTPLQRRNRALIAFTALTAARVAAVASLCLQHIDTNPSLPLILVRQEPDRVHTKFSKHINTYIYPIDETFVNIVLDWIDELKTVHYFGLNDPLFPKTRMGLSESNTFIPIGIEKAHWKTPAPIRTIFKQAFENAGLPYFHPHTFRHALTHYMRSKCQTPDETWAWSQNMGHKNIGTTFGSYGTLSVQQQGEVLAGIGKKSSKPEDIVEKMRKLLDS